MQRSAEESSEGSLCRSLDLLSTMLSRLISPFPFWNNAQSIPSCLAPIALPCSRSFNASWMSAYKKSQVRSLLKHLLSLSLISFRTAWYRSWSNSPQGHDRGQRRFLLVHSLFDFIGICNLIFPIAIESICLTFPQWSQSGRARRPQFSSPSPFASRRRSRTISSLTSGLVLSPITLS